MTRELTLESFAVENKPKGTVAKNNAARIIDFYDDTTGDYGHWSRDFNMHLGYFRRGGNPFDRDALLEQMNVEIAGRLKTEPEPGGLLVDLGCGTGAVARSVAGRYPRSMIKGFTLVPLQVRMASEMNAAAGYKDRIEIVCGDYTRTPLNSGSANGAWAIESACYAGGAAKEDLIKEAARILRPGGRFVVADCFIKSSPANLNFLLKKCYDSVCNYWVLSELPSIGYFVDALKRNNFGDVTVEDISWNVAPSLAHAPIAVGSFIIRKVLKSEKLTQNSIGNLKASMLAAVLGASRRNFGYYLISGSLK